MGYDTVTMIVAFALPIVRAPFGAGLAVMLAATVVTAQDIAPQARVSAGDTWTYQRTNRLNNQVTTWTLRVEEVTDDRILARSGSATERFTLDWNFIDSSTGESWAPHTGLFVFPMQPGQSRELRQQRTNAQRQGQTRQGKVIVHGWETVKVPAGEFRALRLVFEGRYENAASAAQSGHFKQTFWWAPDARRWVRQDFWFSHWGGSGTDTDSRTELTSFTPGP